MKEDEIKKDPDRIDSDSEIEKKSEFEAFVWWYSIPAVVRKMHEKDSEALKDLGYDVDHPILSKLLGIRTQKEFGKEFGVDEDSLTNWKKRGDFRKILKGMNMSENVLKFKKDIDFLFTQKTMKKGDAPRMKLWYQIFCNWSEKTIQAHEGKIDTTPTQNISMITILNKKDPSGRKVGEILRDAIKREAE